MLLEHSNQAFYTQDWNYFSHGYRWTSSKMSTSNRWELWLSLPLVTLVHTDPADFAHLNNYKGQTLITTDYPSAQMISQVSLKSWQLLNTWQLILKSNMEKSVLALVPMKAWAGRSIWCRGFWCRLCLLLMVVLSESFTKTFSAAGAEITFKGTQCPPRWSGAKTNQDSLCLAVTVGVWSVKAKR